MKHTESFSDFCRKNQMEALLKEWDAELNGDLTPQAVSHGSTREVWWRCQKGHSWKSAVYVRTAGKGCPYCGGRRVIPGFNDLASQNGALAAQWDAVKNAPLRPEEVTPGSHRKVWWRCRKGHSWQAEIKSRHSGKGCPVCAGRTAPGITDLKTVAPAAAVRWDPELNGRDTPDRVSAGSSRQAWWRCEKGHFWRSPIRFQSSGERGCPYCMGMKAWYGFNDLETVAPELAAQWDSEKNKELTPRQVTAFSNKKAWWRCPRNHSFQAAISARSRGTGCPYCANKKVLAGYNDLATRFPELGRQWHPTLNGDLVPERIVYGSCRKVWWQCEDGHVWEASAYKRTKKERPTGCPVCAGKTNKERTRRYDRLMAELERPEA